MKMSLRAISPRRDRSSIYGGVHLYVLTDA